MTTFYFRNAGSFHRNTQNKGQADYRRSIQEVEGYEWWLDAVQHLAEADPLHASLARGKADCRGSLRAGDSAGRPWLGGNMHLVSDPVVARS